MKVRVEVDTVDTFIVDADAFAEMFHEEFDDWAERDGHPDDQMGFIRASIEEVGVECVERWAVDTDTQVSVTEIG
jgi:hypothetical protein